MNHMNCKYLFAILSIFCLKVNGQDPHFSQFFASPLTINPANTGNFNGIIRSAANIRNQLPDFSNAYTTKTISIDGSLLKKIIPKKDKFSLGALILSDQSGNKLISNNDISLSISYNKALDQKARSSIIAGFQFNYSKYLFDGSRANFEDELTPVGFNLTTTDILSGNNISRSNFNLNTGLIYMGSFGYENRFYFGTSYYHIIKPVISFSSTNSFKNPRYNIHGGAYVSLSYSTSFHPSFQFQKQGETSELLLGGALSQHLGNEKGYDLYAGLWCRTNDSLIPFLGLEWANIRAGFTYDVGVLNKILSKNMLHSYEFSLIYILNPNNGDPLLKCPKF